MHGNGSYPQIIASPQATRFTLHKIYINNDMIQNQLQNCSNLFWNIIIICLFGYLRIKTVQKYCTSFRLITNPHWSMHMVLYNLNTTVTSNIRNKTSHEISFQRKFQRKMFWTPELILGRTVEICTMFCFKCWGFFSGLKHLYRMLLH